MEDRIKVDPALYRLELPAGWSLWAVQVPDSPKWDQWTLVGWYYLDGWTVQVEANLNTPWVGPSRVAVSYGYDEQGVEAAIESDGITMDVLRRVPLGDARRVVAEWAPKVLAAVAPERAPQKLPERVETPHDYALVAAEYVRLVSSGVRRPIHVMAEACGISRNTMSARVRRAREQGLILQDKTGAKLQAKLSPQAIEILNEKESE